MQNFKLNETEILSNQDWTFPTNVAYGPGRIKEIGSICNKLDIKNPIIVTDIGSPKLSFISNLQSYLTSSNVKSDLFFDISPNPREDEVSVGCKKYKEGKSNTKQTKTNSRRKNSSVSSRARTRATRKAKTKSRTTTGNSLTTVNTSYARVALLLLALNVLFSGYVLYKLMLTT